MGIAKHVSTMLFVVMTVCWWSVARSKRDVFCFKVMAAVKQQGGVNHKGVARSLDNICNNVFVRSGVMAATFNVILKKSWKNGHLPCLLLFTQAIAF